MQSNHLILSYSLLLLPSVFPNIRVVVVFFCFCFCFFFAMSQHFPSGGQSPGASALESVIPMNIQDLFPLGLTGLIPLLSKGLTRVFYSTIFQSISSSVLSLLYGPTLSSIHDYREKKPIILTIWTFVGKVVFLLFNTLSRFVIAFLPKSKYQFISWLQSPPALILEPKEIKSVTVSTFPPSVYLPLSEATECCDLSFLNAEF